MHQNLAICIVKAQIKTKMSTAIITVTENGAYLASKLQDILPDCTIFVKNQRYKIALSDTVIEYSKMSDLITAIFTKFDALIFFTSTGIAVRMIAPYIVHKVKDPAVIVLDEQARFAISLLSGHLGGANELTEKIADILKATPVITTATDTNKLLAPDVVARKLDLVPYPLSHIKTINAALVQGKTIRYFIAKDFPKANILVENLQKNFQITAQLVDDNCLNLSYTPCVLITTKRRVMTNVLSLVPKRLIVGVGCRKDVELSLVESAIAKAKMMTNCEQYEVKTLVSTVVKKDEKALLSWADKHDVTVHFYENAVMQKAIDDFRLDESMFVKKQIGIGNVCEAAILSYNPQAKIVLPKTKFEKVTVSLAWE